MQKINTEDLIYFQFSLEKSWIEKIYDIANYSNDEMFLNLYDINNNLVNPVKEVLENSANGDKTSMNIEAKLQDTDEVIADINEEFEDLNSEICFVPYYRQTTFFDKLERRGKTNLNLHSIDRYAITDTGWNFDGNLIQKDIMSISKVAYMMDIVDVQDGYINTAYLINQEEQEIK